MHVSDSIKNGKDLQYGSSVLKFKARAICCGGCYWLLRSLLRRALCGCVDAYGLCVHMSLFLSYILDYRVQRPADACKAAVTTQSAQPQTGAYPRGPAHAHAGVSAPALIALLLCHGQWDINVDIHARGHDVAIWSVRASNIVQFLLLLLLLTTW